jgi:GH15 family glucan-1,4-alpha-glucosidase
MDDGRPRQLDAVGWTPWAVWSWWQSSGDRAVLRELWPMLTRAADAALDAIQADGLPRPSADYTEQPQSRPTLGIAAPLLLGLRSAADLADALGDEPARQRWSAAARRLDTAIGATFGRTGYRRHPDGGAGADCAIAFLSAPLAPLADNSGVRSALANDEHELLMASGGLRPGDMPHVRDTAWTTSTALFALADAGNDRAFHHWFSWLAAHRTGLGELPEKVSPDGRPASVAPLGWTDAILLLALAGRDGLVATPPMPRP